MSNGILHESPILPQELFDKIIDELSSDEEPEDPTNRAALLACALVCRSFYTRATIHIFSTIYILDKGPDLMFHPWLTQRIANLSNILLANPAIVHHTHSVTVLSRSPHHHREGSPVLTSPHLPVILSQLSNVRSFQLKNRFRSINWDRYSKPLQSSITSIIWSPLLTTLHLRGIQDIPLSLLSPCTNLKALSLAAIRSVLDHTNTSFKPGFSDDAGQISPPPFHATFLLESANIREAAAFLIPLVHCARAGHNIFARLSHLSTQVNDLVDIWSSREVLRQAADSLVSLDFVNVDSNRYPMSPVRTNLTELLAEPRALRELKLHSTICPREGDVFPNLLFFLLGPKCPITTLETLNISLEWESLDGDFDPFILQPQHGWAALDAKLSNGNFPSLRSLTIYLQLEYHWTEDQLAEITDKTLNKIYEYLPGLLPSTAELLGDGLKYVVRPMPDPCWPYYY